MSDLAIVVIMGGFLIWLVNKANTQYSNVELREAFVESQIEKTDIKRELDEIRKLNKELTQQVEAHRQEVEKYEKLLEEWGK